MRWLLLKDLQILRRSPLLVGLLALYAVVIGLPVGYAVSRPPAKPKVALFSAVPPSASAFSVGSRRLDTQTYAERLFDAIDPVRVHSRAAAIAKVRSGEALAALVIPADVTRALQSALSLNARTKPPTLEVYYNAENPLKRRYVENTINAQLAKANQALSAELTKTAARDIQILLRGGGFSILGKRFDILGLQRSAAVLGSVARALPANDPRRRAVEQVRRFAQLAIDNLDLTGPVLASIATPIRAQVNSVDGRTSSLDGFAVAAAVTVAVMVIGLLIAAGMLALEREEHAYGRLVRGLVSRGGMLLVLVARRRFAVRRAAA